MFYHGFDNYMTHAFPMDELRPISCRGSDTFGKYALTYIDSLDSLLVMGDYAEFEKGVQWVIDNIRFDKDINVSVFETNIRVLGGLLSAHLWAEKVIKNYTGGLLPLALDLGKRLLLAFDTPTGIPYGTLNLLHGVTPGETTVTCTAGGGTFSLEFGILSKLTGIPDFEVAAKRAVRSLWKYRSEIDLVGNHIDIATGEWTIKESGVGTGVDSFFEYLFKSAIFFDDEDLQSFWPGLQALMGQFEEGFGTIKAFHAVWRRFGFIPEGYNLMSGSVHPGQKSYPLRPELAESLYYMYHTTKDPLFMKMGRDLVWTLSNVTRTKCGHSVVLDVEKHNLEDKMESFFLAETCKYLYMLFDDSNMFFEKSPTTMALLAKKIKRINIKEEPTDSGAKETTEVGPQGTSQASNLREEIPNDDTLKLESSWRCSPQSYLRKISSGSLQLLGKMQYEPEWYEDGRILESFSKLD
eukprot:gene15986-19016_t